MWIQIELENNRETALSINLSVQRNFDNNEEHEYYPQDKRQSENISRIQGTVIAL